MNTEKKKKPSKATVKSRVKDKKQGGFVSMYSNTDPDGSYTGVPRDKDEIPVQDADDL